MTEISEAALLVVDILRTSGVNKENTLKIMRLIYPSEEKMVKLVDYIDANQQATPAEILAKAMEISDMR